MVDIVYPGTRVDGPYHPSIIGPVRPEDYVHEPLECCWALWRLKGRTLYCQLLSAILNAVLGFASSRMVLQ